MLADTITAPSPGIVIVNVSGDFGFSSLFRDDAACSITTGTTVDHYHSFFAVDYGNSVGAMPFASTRGFNVGPGSTTFNLVCKEYRGDVRVNNTHMTLIFLPTLY